MSSTSRHCRVAVRAWWWWGDQRVAALFNRVPQTGGDGESPPAEPCRHKSFGTIGGQGAVAAEVVSPLVAVAAQDQPHGPLGVAHEPAEEVGEVGQEVDHNRTILFLFLSMMSQLVGRLPMCERLPRSVVPWKSWSGA